MKRLTLSSDPVREYAAMLDAADTLPKLQSALKEWDELAGEAADRVAGWSEADFAGWRKALASERRGRFMGEERAARFLPVLLPVPMFQIQAVATQFHVPFIVAFDRLRDMGYLVRSTKNRYRLREEVAS